ncbi:MAG: inositol monophosphatase [Ruminococcaceae bacterium]|nr:inositol monophosphatase [Oscillospiraceae bacterium]
MIEYNKAEKGCTMLEKIVNAVLQAGEIYKSAGNDLEVIEKGSNVNLVTKYDKLIQDFLVAELTKIIPDAHFMCEEGDGKKEVSDGYCFIIDPIDGTTNFIKGFQHSAISVGLTKDKELFLGVVLDPDRNNIYYAQKGCGAFLNGKPIHASNEDMENSLVLFGTCPYEHEFAHQTFELAEQLFLRSIEVRRGGSAALDICFVAAGKADFYYELILRPWDWVGATVILEEAGGIAKTADGEDVDPSKIQSYICGNAKNIKEFYELYKS